SWGPGRRHPSETAAGCPFVTPGRYAVSAATAGALRPGESGVEQPAHSPGVPVVVTYCVSIAQILLFRNGRSDVRAMLRCPKGCYGVRSLTCYDIRSTIPLWLATLRTKCSPLSAERCRHAGSHSEVSPAPSDGTRSTRTAGSAALWS